MIPAGFEPTACRLGGDRSILLSYGTSFSKVFIFQGYRGIGDCSPWCLGVAFANREGRFLISFSNFGGRTFSHLLILTLRIRDVGLIPFPGHFRTLRPFSVSGKAAVGLFLRRRPLYPTELRVHWMETLTALQSGFQTIILPFQIQIVNLRVACRTLPGKRHFRHQTPICPCGKWGRFSRLLSPHQYPGPHNRS